MVPLARKDKQPEATQVIHCDQDSQDQSGVVLLLDVLLNQDLICVDLHSTGPVFSYSPATPSTFDQSAKKAKYQPTETFELAQIVLGKLPRLTVYRAGFNPNALGSDALLTAKRILSVIFAGNACLDGWHADGGRGYSLLLERILSPVAVGGSAAVAAGSIATMLFRHIGSPLGKSGRRPLLSIDEAYLLNV